MGDLRIDAYREPWSDCFAIIIGTRTHVLRPARVVLEEVEGGTRVEPTLRIAYQEAQALLDRLWTAGLRPSDGSGSAGQLAATEKHLSDMRRLVESTVGVEFK